MLTAVAIAVSIMLLWKGADWVVEGASAVASRVGLSELVIGMTIVALGTSAPEIVVSLVAAFRGQSDIAVANVVGSNICNTGLILGMCAAVYSVRTSPTIVRRDLPCLIGATLLLMLFLANGTLGWIEGLAMVTLLACYIAYVIRVDGSDGTAAALAESVPVHSGQAPDSRKDGPWGALRAVLAGHESSSPWMSYIQLALGLACVLIGARLLVGAATTIARDLGLSDWVIGVTVVAGGTSLPELATSFVAAKRGHAGMVIGNLVGSDLFNCLAVLGLAGMVSGLTVDTEAQTGLLMMLAMLSLLLVFMRSGWRLSHLEGVALVGLALARWGYDISTAT
jgi:cation:H+ antiporter